MSKKAVESSMARQGRSPRRRWGLTRPDKAAAESFFSTLEHDLVSRSRYRTRDQARADVAIWIDAWHDRRRLHSTNNMTRPIEHELANAA